MQVAGETPFSWGGTSIDVEGSTRTDYLLNYSTAILSDEYGNFQCEFSVEELLRPEIPWSFGLVQFHVRKVYPPDNSLLFVVGFDTVITKICGNRRLL